MHRLTKLFLGAVVGGSLVLAWGYWHALGHASLHLQVNDHALKSANVLYDSPHHVRLTLRDRAGGVLAMAQSVEPQGYILAVHPDASIGNCERRGDPGAAVQTSQADYAACYRRYSAWSANWAPRVHSADVVVGACSLRGVPVEVRRSNSEWLLWWVPLPHVGGVPRQYFAFSVAIDSGTCTSVVR